MMEKPRVLVVEDEPETRYILDRLLTKNNFDVITAENGEEALEKIKTKPPKVIIADWTMPVMDGIELCKIIKQNDQYKSVYYIILTARVLIEDRVKGLDIGADDFLTKPVENEELLARIRAGVRIFNLQNELKKVEHTKALIEMACTIGHQINNPLSSLMMSLQNIEDEIDITNNENVKYDLEVIQKSAVKIKKLTADLTQLQNPEVIDYTSDNKMIKLNK
ncbi:MAG: response regulator [Ignavibacteriae bacterium]|nr:response regulator [Ignavibacteriota bacterium]NOG97179.1 response regulator [Ignavibacteriota bacterium]